MVFSSVCFVVSVYYRHLSDISSQFGDINYTIFGAKKCVYYSFLRLVGVIYLSANVLTIGNSQAGAAVPLYMNGADIIDRNDCTFAAGNEARVKGIIHVNQLHSCSLGETLTKGFEGFF